MNLRGYNEVAPSLVQCNSKGTRLGHQFAFHLEQELESRYFHFYEQVALEVGSGGLCIAAAGFKVFVFRGSPFKTFFPFLFLAIIVFVASKFGSVAGILGTIGAATVFAEFLFEPAFSLRVSDSVQRDNLIWMVIVGVAASEILGVRPKSPTHSNPHRKDFSGL